MEWTPEAMAEAKQVAAHLSVGILRQDRAIQQGSAAPVTLLDEQLQWGWDKLAALCRKHGQAGPRHVHELVSWLHQPLETWDTIGPLLEAAGLSGALLYYGTPSELCDQLSRDMHLAADLERELHDLAFKEILAYCQEKHLAEQYTLARRFLVEHPYLPEGGIVISADHRFDPEIRKWLFQAYEQVPPVCYRKLDGQDCIALCPRCGWPLEWRTQRRDQARCYGELCNRLVSNLHDPAEWKPVLPEAMRTTRGIQASVVAPEQPLIQIFRVFTDRLGLPCDLWPEVDSYDLLVSFPDGERWAVDMKDVEKPVRFAQDLLPFKPVPPWDRAFFLFPDHRRRPGYLQAFRTHWRGAARTEALFAEDFIQRVREKAR